MLQLILSTDPGEEFDDFAAFDYLLERADGSMKIYVVLSAGSEAPLARFLKLMQYVAPMTLDQLEAKGLHFVMDDYGGAKTLEKLTGVNYWVNNGPNTPDTLASISQSLAPDARVYLVGADGAHHEGGINQKCIGDPKYWKETFIPSLKDVQFVDYPPEKTRANRFTIAEVTRPFAQEIAKSTTLMFMASRPTIPKKYCDFEFHLRINAANAFVCDAWRAELDLSTTRQSKLRAVVKTDDYIKCLRDVMGHQSTSAQTIFQIQSAQKSGLLQSTDIDSYDEWDIMHQLAYIPVQFMYDIAEKCGVRQPYQPDKYGYGNNKKMEANPGGTFKDVETVVALKNYIWEHFQTLTPKYDLESLSDCLRDAAARSTSEQEAGNIFDTMSKGSDTLSKTKFREFLKKDAELKVRVFGRVDVPWKEVYRKIDANHDGKFSKLEFVLAFVRAEQATNTLLGTLSAEDKAEIRKVFSVHAGADTKITELELATSLERVGDPTPTETAHSMFEANDTDNDGFITLFEFMVWCAKTNAVRSWHGTQAAEGSVFFNGSPAKSILYGIGAVTAGLVVVMRDKQRAGGPTLMGDFKFVNPSSIAEAIEQHLSHVADKATVAGLSTKLMSKKKCNVDSMRANILEIVGVRDNAQLLNEHLFHPSNWAVYQ